jgi:beta-galactosidase
VDKQSVAIVQNGENIATEKRGRTGRYLIGTTWYRNKFTVPIDSKGKKIILFFEGAMSEPQVYLNGKKWRMGIWL